jgi:hypothetical protein
MKKTYLTIFILTLFALLISKNNVFANEENSTNFNQNKDLTQNTTQNNQEFDEKEIEDEDTFTGSIKANTSILHSNSTEKISLTNQNEVTNPSRTSKSKNTKDNNSGSSKIETQNINNTPTPTPQNSVIQRNETKLTNNFNFLDEIKKILISLQKIIFTTLS